MDVFVNSWGVNIMEILDLDLENKCTLIAYLALRSNSTP